MPTPAKQEAIEELSDVFSRAKSVVLTNYQGIPADEMTVFRAEMKSRSLDFRVAKNTLAQIASKGTSFEVLKSEFKGPVSMLISFDDLVAPAKALADYEKSGAENNPKVLCGLVEGKAISAAEVKLLSDLPSREVLLSQMLSVFQGPTTQFAGVFSSLLRKLVGTLEAVKEKKAQS